MSRFQSIWMLLLRSLGLLSKFVLLLYLAKAYSIEEVGEYGIMFSTIIFSITFIGFELYFVTAKEFRQSFDFSKRSGYIKTHFIFIHGSYLISIPIILIALSFFSFPELRLFQIVLLVYLELIIQEVYRLLLAVEKLMSAALLMLMRTSFWVALLITVNLIDGGTRNIEYLSFVWVVGQLVTFFYAIYLLKIIKGVDIVEAKVNWKWLRKAIVLAFPVYIALLLYRGVFTADKFIIKLLIDEYNVGVYVLILSFATAAVTLVDSSVFARFYSRILSLSRSGKEQSLKITFGVFYRDMVLFSVIIFIASYFTMLYAAEVFSLQSVSEYKVVALVVFAALFLNSLSQAYYLVIYAKGFYKEIVFSNSIFAVVFFSSSFLLVSNYRLMGVVASLFLASFVLFCMRYLYFKKI